jgi:hypothetical protein
LEHNPLLQGGLATKFIVVEDEVPAEKLFMPFKEDI